MDKTNPLWPFAGPCYDGIQTYYMSADDRIASVRLMDYATLSAALLVAGLQKTVERAIRSRIRKLEGQP